MKKEKGLEIIKERVEDFEKNKALIMKKGYGETNIRTNYIDVMFEALGWNIRNKFEVEREFSQKDKSKEANTKKVDYAFKLKGKLKFFIEAKEASVDLEHNKDAIYQAKRYAYSSNGKAPIVILTDFEEFRVFNVLTAPLYNNPDKQLLKSHSIQYNEYIGKWDLLWNTFSKEAVENGSLDELRGTITKNTKTMDKDFLEQITKWRGNLAKNIAIRNEDLSVDDINEAVQRILDRLIFIRNLEDRGIEPENTLLNIVKNKINILKSLIPLFNSLNTTYNGLLFKPHFSEKISVDDKCLYDVIREMCYPISPFQFDVIEPEILGRIYEKFLGSKIRLTDSHRAKIEEKPEVRHAGGVYYTPEYIVEYIVKNTVGIKIEGLTPEEIKNIKIVDPACGSGSFLIGAYNYLLDYHLRWYKKNMTEKNYKPDWYKTKDGEITINLHKRGDILKNNIFGVDIDKEATEVAVMSLYLKMLDDGFDKGERDLFFVKGAILPDMTGNIKCGNSLIDNSYFNQLSLIQITNEELFKINPFDWKKEFDNVFKKGGFDCLVGNPPYIRIQTLNESQPEQVKYFNEMYKKYVSSNYDIYILFLHKAYSLINSTGIFGYILPHKFFQGESGQKIRDYFGEMRCVSEIIHFGTNQVFENATTYTCLFFSGKKKIEYFNYKQFKLGFAFTKLEKLKFQSVNSAQLQGEMWNFHSEDKLKIIEKIRSAGLTFEKITNKIFKGSSTGNDKIFLLEIIEKGENTSTCYSKYLDKNVQIESNIIKPFLNGSDVRKYFVNDVSSFLIFPYEIRNEKASLIDLNKLKKEFPNTYEYLKTCKQELLKRKIKMDNLNFYKFSAARSLTEYFQKKIMIPDMLVENRIAFDGNGEYFHGPAIHSVVFNKEIAMHEDLVYLSILNSNLFWFFIENTSTALRGDAYRLTPEFLNNFCFPSNLKSNEEKLLNLANQIIIDQRKINKGKLSEKEMELLKRKMYFLQQEVNKIIYKVYNISDKEILLIEGI